MPATARKIVRRAEPQEEAHEARKRPERLSPAKLMALVRKARAAKTDAQRKRLEDEFIRGFYGTEAPPATAKRLPRLGAQPKQGSAKRMTPPELERVAREMVAVADDDPAEANRLQERLVRGFYGDDK